MIEALSALIGVATLLAAASVTWARDYRWVAFSWMCLGVCVGVQEWANGAPWIAVGEWLTSAWVATLVVIYPAFSGMNRQRAPWLQAVAAGVLGSMIAVGLVILLVRWRQPSTELGSMASGAGVLMVTTTLLLLVTWLLWFGSTSHARPENRRGSGS